VSFSYSDMDQLILQRWTDVVGLIDAHRNTQNRIEEMIEVVGERLARWARPMGFETNVDAREAEFYAWRPSWSEKRKDPKVVLVLGGFCPMGFRKTDVAHPFQWVFIDGLSNYRMKEAERAMFARSLRIALGDEAKSWEADDVDDEDQPLGRYLTKISDKDRSSIISSPDALFAFANEHFPALFQLADTIEAELNKIGR
jgi:hypothetical protein